MTIPPAGRSRLDAARIFLCFAAGYFMSFALRSIGAVIAPELVRDFGLTNAELGALSSAYFLAFAAVQLPLGVWLDRFGARRTHGALLLVSSAGCAVFAASEQVTGLWIGRALTGVGVAGALMAALKGFRFWFAPQRQQQLAAWMLVAGSFGALATTVPVRLALPLLGWRGLFWLASGLFVITSLLILLLLPRDEERSSKAQLDGGSLWNGYAQVFSDAYFWRFAIVSILSHAGFVSLQTLWAGPWLIQVLGLSPADSAQVLFLFNLALMSGFLGVGVMAPAIQRRGVPMPVIVAVGTCGLLSVELLIAYSSGTHAWLLWPLLAVSSTFFAMLQPHVSLSFPAALTGRAYTGYNLLIFTAMFSWQWLFGVGVDLWAATGRHSEAAFRATLYSAITIQVLGLLIFWFWKAQPASARAGKPA